MPYIFYFEESNPEIRTPYPYGLQHLPLWKFRTTRLDPLPIAFDSNKDNQSSKLVYVFFYSDTFFPQLLEGKSQGGSSLVFLDFSFKHYMVMK